MCAHPVQCCLHFSSAMLLKPSSVLVSVRLDRHARWRCHFVDRTETNMAVEIKGIVFQEIHEICPVGRLKLTVSAVFWL